MLYWSVWFVNQISNHLHFVTTMVLFVWYKCAGMCAFCKHVFVWAHVGNVPMTSIKIVIYLNVLCFCKQKVYAIPPLFKQKMYLTLDLNSGLGNIMIGFENLNRSGKTLELINYYATVYVTFYQWKSLQFNYLLCFNKPKNVFHGDIRIHLSAKNE